ncbi:MAG: hypothetical protein M1833_000273 [Piccolia ochrophora]|nr:MAG: hypothetical protein M1833_000273 [Piccolia ochrophora]
MYHLDAIRASNAALKKLPPGLVALFVGGTNGIGASTLRNFVKNTTAPRVYFVGRNEAAAEQVTQECKALNADASITFYKADLTLLSSVDRVCEEFKAREKHLNLLFLTPGFLSLQGRNESPEGLDRKLAVHYYARMLFVQHLLPLLTAAPSLARVVAILAPSREKGLLEDDLDLARNYSIRNCEGHSVTLTSLAFEHLSAVHPSVGFVHALPGVVATNILAAHSAPAAYLSKLVLFAMKPWLVPLDESGERHLFQATSAAFAGAAPDGNAGVPLAEGLRPATGAGGKEASGVYLVNWESKDVGKESVLKGYRERGYGETVWEHTLEMFEKAKVAKPEAT